ncbi:MAG: hypothetical protein AB7T48_03750 [Solirubrobacterales bacterium]
MDLPSAIGLGLDIAGATIIAVGLLGHPATMALRATSFWGSSAPTAVAQAESRADAEFGIPIFACGFLGQLIGLGVHSEASVQLGYAAAFVCAAGSIAVWRWLWRERRAKHLAIEIAHYRFERVTRLAQRSPRPSLERLVSMGTGFGVEARDGESDESYVERVFGVTDAVSSQDEG